MAATFCPGCNVPLTASESQSGKCHLCKTRLPRPGSEATAAADAPSEQKKLGTWTLLLILFVAGCIGAVIEAALFNFRSGTSTFGAIGGISFVYGLLYNLGYVKKKENRNAN